MNWVKSPAQQELLRFLEAPVFAETKAKVKKPRKPNSELLEFIAGKFRELGRPPKLADLDPHRCLILSRFGGHGPALKRASREILTPAEREKYVWRCKLCQATGFKSSRGFGTHERSCTENSKRRESNERKGTM